MSALRLTEKGYRVAVLEAGKRFSGKDFPRTNWNLRKYLFFPRVGMHGIQRMNLLNDVVVLSGAGVGGGSLVYANTLYEPLPGFYTDPQWDNITDWEAELAPYYHQAQQMLGVTTAPANSPNDAVIREIGERMEAGATYHPTQVGVFFGRPGERTPDPYFGGAGPDRNGCIKCGGCMVGCQHDSKNSLDYNYLYLAEQGGTRVFPRTQATQVSPLPGGGYEVFTERPGPRRGQKVKRLTAEQVIFSAGVFGTVRLLADMKDRGHLPDVSPRLGDLVRTNSESIPGAVADDTDVDYSTGIAISSSIYPNPHTHIEGVRYPRGSNAMALLTTVLVDGGGAMSRQRRFIGEALRHPVKFLRSLSVRRWSERSVILLVMQSTDNSIKLRWRTRRGGSVWFRTEQGSGEPNPTYLPEANEAARHAADIIDGEPFGSLNEALLDAPVTAHILGGCVIGEDPEHGVLDAYQRVFGHEGLHVCDGSAISANLGVNPALTITAQAERAISYWPNRGDEDQRPTLGNPYQDVDPVSPGKPAVPEGVPATLSW